MEELQIGEKYRCEIIYGPCSGIYDIKVNAIHDMDDPRGGTTKMAKLTAQLHQKYAPTAFNRGEITVPISVIREITKLDGGSRYQIKYSKKRSKRRKTKRRSTKRRSTKRRSKQRKYKKRSKRR